RAEQSAYIQGLTATRRQNSITDYPNTYTLIHTSQVAYLQLLY
ncbi:hypothetical protein LINPERHAP2_LOCUS9681, partial [Linum perenne]